MAAILCMALFLLSACGGSSGAASSTPEPNSALATRATSGTPATKFAQRAVRAPKPIATSTDTPEPSATPSPTPQPPVTFAVIGDDGTHGAGEKKVADMVKGWKPDFILDTGDAYYSSAGGYNTGKYDRSVGTYYCNYLKDVTTTGTDCPHGTAGRNRFFPTLGNHDYSDASVENYLKYFDLPGSGFKNTSGNERYYDFTWGPVHFFSLNSNVEEPDGVTGGSKQAQWLKTQLSKSTSAWNIVFFHHPPYSSGASHGSDETMRWPFKAWGVTAVFNGHEHLYERLIENGVVYFVNGSGGSDQYQFDPTPQPGSQSRIAGKWGAQKVTVTGQRIRFEYYTADGKLADSYTLNK